MFSRISRAATKRSFQAARNFSGDPAVAAKEASTWVKYSWGMVGLTVVCAAYNIVGGSHPHRGQELSYMRLRAKPYPWTECPDCNIFDGDCWTVCRGGEAASHH